MGLDAFKLRSAAYESHETHRLKEKVHNLDMAAHGGPVKRRVVSNIEGVHFSPVLDQELHRLKVPVVRRAGERGLLHQPGLLQVGTLVHEEVTHGGVSVPGGEEQRRISAVVSLVQRGTLQRRRGGWKEGMTLSEKSGLVGAWVK